MKVAIIGTVPTSKNLAPYSDPSWEIWACSAGNSQAGALPRVTRFFEIHALVDMTGEENRGWSLPFYEWLKAQSFPVYMQERNDLVPNAWVYPMREMVKKFGHRWFTSSVAWMMALAITEMEQRPGEEHQIALFGIDLAANQEAHTQQKAGCMRFMELAEDRGIKIATPYESCLGLPPPLYGYSEATNEGRRLNVRVLELSVQTQRMTDQINELTIKRAQFVGAAEESKYWLRTLPLGLGADLDDGSEPKAVEPMKKMQPQFEGLHLVPLGDAGKPALDESTGPKHYTMPADTVVLGITAPSPFDEVAAAEPAAAVDPPLEQGQLAQG